MSEAAHGEPLRLACHNAEFMTSSRQHCDCIDHLVVTTDEPIVVNELILAVCPYERGFVCFVARVSAEHREQRNSNTCHPLTVGRTFAAELTEGVAGGVE